MIISALVISPKAIVLGQPIDIIVVVEGAERSQVVEICVSVAWPFEIEEQAMLCQTVLGSPPLSVSFRARLTTKAAASTCQITALADAEDGQSCSALEVAEVIPHRRSPP